MPSDDLVLNVRQVAGYSPTGNAPPSSALLIQLGGLGGPYASISPQDLVATALATGGDMAIAGALAVQSVSGGSAQFSNGTFGMLTAQKACIVDFAATWGTVGGVQIATVNDVSALDAALRASTVWSFNGRTGDVRLWIDDIRCAGGAPIYSPRFEGSPRAWTPPPESNSSRLATTAFVQNALGVSFDQFAPLDSPNFTGVPTAPTAAVGASDGQLATTAFVQNAVTESTTGVASFNTRTGVVLLTAADLTSVGGALLAGPAFTGVPTAATATPGTNSTQLATCAFVAAAVAAATAGVASFNGRTGDVVLTAADVGAVGVATFNGRAGTVFLLGNDVSAAGGALLAGPSFTGAPTAPTAALGTGTTQLATCAFVQNAVAAVTAGVTSWNGRSGAVTLQSADIAAVGGALLVSPAFTGAPSAPTAAPGVSTTQLATTAFVAAAVSAGTAGVASFNSRTGAVTLLVADISAAGGALLASPAFTGIPTGPTALPSVSTTQLATTAFVNSVLPSASTAAPLVNGTASAGSSAAWSRGDHVHPTDASRAPATALANYLPLIGGTVTGALNVSGAGGLTISGPGGLTTNAGAILAASVSITQTPGINYDYFELGLGPIGFWWQSSVSALHAMLNGTDLGIISFTSDYRIKKDVTPLGSMWERAKALNPIRYTHKAFTPTNVKGERASAPLIIDDDVERWGFVAHELQETLIESAANGVKDQADCIQSPNPWPVLATLTKALQEAMTRIEQLELARTA